MWIFYILSLLPIAAAGLVWYFDSNKITWWEALCGAGIAVVLSVIFHIAAFYGMTADVEIWSGQVTSVTFHPYWVEEQTYTTTTTDSDGNSHTETHHVYISHPEFWDGDSNIGSTREISHSTFNSLKEKFGGEVKAIWEWKSGFYSGDHDIYTTYNRTNYMVPISESRHWVNRVKATPSTFSFPPVPASAKVFDYPVSDDWFQSNRLVNVPNIDITLFDKMQAGLGPDKHVNIIMVGFPPNSDEKIAHYQQAKWVGGKQNDIVICFGGGDGATKPQWVYVFGWTEKEIVKVNLQSMLLERPVNNDLIPLIRDEVAKNYVIKDWTKFDYLTINPPAWSFFLFFFVILVVQGGFFIWADKNEYEPENNF